MTITRTCPRSPTARGQVIQTASDTVPDGHREAWHTGIAPRAQRRAGPERYTADCAHPGRRHRHGTRAAYVKDRCRCGDCTAANTAHSRQIARAKAMGRWHPYTDVAPVRAHIGQLRSANIGYRQIARAAGTSTGHIREIGASSTRSAGRPPIVRIRVELAHRILTIQAQPNNVAPNTKIPAQGTRRRLQALAAVGWPIAELAAFLHRSPSQLEPILHAARVTARTAKAVDELYCSLWDRHPPTTTGAQRDAATAAQQHAAGAHWAPPLAWDDIDTDPEPIGTSPDSGELDEIAVDRAVHGDHIQLPDLTSAEQAEAIRRLTKLGRSLRQIADQLGTTERTIARRRSAGNAA